MAAVAEDDEVGVQLVAQPQDLVGGPPRPQVGRHRHPLGLEGGDDGVEHRSGLVLDALAQRGTQGHGVRPGGDERDVDDVDLGPRRARQLEGAVVRQPGGR